MERFAFYEAQVTLLERNTNKRILIIHNTEGEIDGDPASLRKGWFNMEKVGQLRRADVCYLTLVDEELAVVIEKCNGLQAEFMAGTTL
jgi:hypothetical protein